MIAPTDDLREDLSDRIRPADGLQAFEPTLAEFIGIALEPDADAGAECAEDAEASPIAFSAEALRGDLPGEDYEAEANYRAALARSEAAIIAEAEDADEAAERAEDERAAADLD